MCDLGLHMAAFMKKEVACTVEGGVAHDIWMRGRVNDGGCFVSLLIAPAPSARNAAQQHQTSSPCPRQCFVEAVHVPPGISKLWLAEATPVGSKRTTG